MLHCHGRTFFALVIATAVCLCSAKAASSDDWIVLEQAGSAARAKEMLKDYLRTQVHAALDRRMQTYESLNAREEVVDHQHRLREAFVKSLGGYPERTPLNPQVVGTFSGDGYHGEKVVYESQPGFFVTACLYLPVGTPPYPGVLLPCGHSENGKAADAYQRASMLLARNGFAVLCYDPIGQGERKQVLKTDGEGRPLPAGRFRSTVEHSLVGVAPILLGRNLATYRIWDGICGIDFLASRKDVDASRIGCTGNSGGGLMTSYLMALDDRIVAAAPSCFLTTTRLKNDRPGPGDAEQNIFGQIRYGMDHPDYVIMRAPKPTLICAATQDFVPIEGAWEAYRQAKRIYTRLGHAERVDLIEADEKHGFSTHLRVGATRWMRRWLLERDDAIRERDLPVHGDHDLQCTPDAQVMLLDGARSIFELNQQHAVKLAEKRKRLHEQTSTGQLREQIRKLAGIRRLTKIPRSAVDHVAILQRDGYRVKKVVLRPEPGIMLPALHFLPDKPTGRATLYLHGNGKSTDADATIARLVEQGRQVLAVDLRGFGETESDPWRFSAEYFGNNAAEYFIAYMLGRSLVGMRAEDILTSARYLAESSGGTTTMDLIAVGKAAIPALHAAACEPDSFASLKVKGCLDSWQRVIDTPVTVDQIENTVHGALAVYDLPDLVELFGRTRVHMEDVRDARGQFTPSAGSGQ